MSTVKITYKPEEVVVDDRKVASICPCFEPGNAYIDMEVYEGTVYDTNVEGSGPMFGMEEWLSQITTHKGVQLMFKAAAESEEGEIEFDVCDPQLAQYYAEVAKKAAGKGFAVEVTLKSE